MEAGLPEEDSAQSKEGTLLHTFDANPKLERAVLKPQQQNLLRISAVTDEFIFGLVAQQFNISASEPFEEGREKELDGYTPGHCDRWRLYPELSLLVIIDKKFGFKEVTPAEANYQLRTYAINGAAEWNTENVVVAISQPRLPYEQRCTMASYNRQDIESARVELSSIRAASARPDAPLIAGEEQCRYCRAKTICPAYNSKLVPLQWLDKEIVNTLGQLSVEQRDNLIVACKFADFIKDAVYDHEREVIAAGGESLYTLGKAAQTRTITDPKRAISTLVLRGDLSKDEVYECCEPKLGALEEKMRAKKKCTWKVAKETVEHTLDAVLERGTKKPSLTRKKNGTT